MSDEKNEISKVPPPIEPLSGSSSPPLIWHKPDWNFWKHKTKIKLWEAAFLCCDIDSRNQGYRDIKGRHYEKVAIYLNLLKDNLNRLDFEFVNLPEVAEWALSKDLDIPKELAALAESQDTDTVDKSENKQTLSSTNRGIPKQEVITAFGELHFRDYSRWNKALGAPPQWLKHCRVMKGSKKTSALWNPADIAVALIDKGVPLKKLDSVFIGLKKWINEWQDKSDYFR